MRMVFPVIFAGFLVFGITARAVPRQQSYEAIPERNIFALRPTEQPQVNHAPPGEGVPKIMLTGITTILGNKRALFKANPSSAPGQPATNELYMMLTEGQSEAFLEVLAIDEYKGTVRVVNSGLPMTLSLDKDGPKPPPSASLVQQNTGMTNRPVPMVPTRGSYTVPGRATTQVPSPGTGALAPTGTNSTRVLITDERFNGSRVYALDAPVANVSTDTPQTAIVPLPMLPPRDIRLSPEEQAIYEEVQREVSRQDAQNQNQPALPPPVQGFPPTGAMGISPSTNSGGSQPGAMAPTGSGRGMLPSSESIPPPGAMSPTLGTDNLPPSGTLPGRLFTQ